MNNKVNTRKEKDKKENKENNMEKDEENKENIKEKTKDKKEKVTNWLILRYNTRNQRRGHRHKQMMEPRVVRAREAGMRMGDMEVEMGDTGLFRLFLVIGGKVEGSSMDRR